METKQSGSEAEEVVFDALAFLEDLLFEPYVEPKSSGVCTHIENKPIPRLPQLY